MELLLAEAALPLSYRCMRNEADSNRRRTITHELRPIRKARRIRYEPGITCSTTELPRHLEPEAGVEPATTHLRGDNPIQQPVERDAGKERLGNPSVARWRGVRTRLQSKDCFIQITQSQRPAKEASMDKKCSGVETGWQASNLRPPDVHPVALSPLSYIRGLFLDGARTHGGRPIESGEQR